MTSEVRPEDLLTVAECARRHPNLGTEAAHRWHIFTRGEELESAGAIARRGRRVFLVIPRYIAWMAGETKAG